VYRRNLRADIQRISQVLAGLDFPAAKWQLIMYAEEYGADSTTRADLWSLPTGVYIDVSRVLAALGLVAHPTRPGTGHRPPPTMRVVGRERL
jgi:Protein of unknown function (DUF2795)